MNASIVVADTSVLTGGLTFFHQAGFPNPWEATISNSQNAPAGTYTIPVMSQSPASPAYRTFNYFTIDVIPDIPSPTVFGEDKEIEGDDVFQYTETLSSGHHGIACRNDNFYLGFWGQSEYNQGAVYFTKSSDKGENWTVAQSLTDPDDDYIESNPAMALGSANIYIVFQSDQLGDSKIGIAVSDDDGATWTLHWVTQYFGGAHFEPSVCVNNDVSPEIIYVAFIGVSTNDFLGVAHASASNPDSWTYTDVNDSSDGPLTMAGTSIAYNQVTDQIMVCWSDERADIYPDGNRVAFDSSSNGINWGTDIWISDIWNSGDNEDEASLAINPMTGVPGILYWHFDYITHLAVIRFIKATDSTGTAFLPSIVISDLDAGHWSIVGPTLQCEQSGRWLAAWAHSEWSFSRYNCFFDESFDDGTTWGIDIQVNDPINPTVYNPVLATNGTDVCIGWTDERNARPEIYVDHGTH